MQIIRAARSRSRRNRSGCACLEARHFSKQYGSNKISYQTNAEGHNPAASQGGWRIKPTVTESGIRIRTSTWVAAIHDASLGARRRH
eukprot:scaffold324069_cov23-Prasinocladus_malaysianus.AAC.1